MIRRRELTVLAALLAMPLAKAQLPGRVYRLAILHPASRAPIDVNLPKALRDLGYVEGQNLVIERRYAEDRLERLNEFAREQVAAKADVILAIGNSAVRASMAATTTVPIVLFGNFDPVALGFAKSLGQPGGNVTGVLIAPDGTLAGKKLELLREVVPRATRIGVLTPADPAARAQLAEVQRMARALGMVVVPVEVGNGDYDRAFRILASERVDGLYVAAAPVFFRDRRQIVERAARFRMPAIYEWREYVEEGGLMAYATSLAALHTRIADYIDRMFDGASPGQTPIEQPSKFDLVINKRTARSLGLVLAPSLLLRADVVE
jgi:putative ABC transport system substrate-binding protein